MQEFLGYTVMALDHNSERLYYGIDHNTGGYPVWLSHYSEVSNGTDERLFNQLKDAKSTEYMTRGVIEGSITIASICISVDPISSREII